MHSTRDLNRNVNPLMPFSALLGRHKKLAEAAILFIFLQDPVTAHYFGS